MLVAILMVVTAAWADVQLLDFHGYDWFWLGDPGDPGSCYGAVGEVVSVNSSYLTFDYGTFEYTFDWDFSCFVSGDTLGGTYGVYTYDGSTSHFNVYCDSLSSGTPGDYGVNPPNLEIASFTDGTMVLSGSWDGDLTVVVNLTTGEGSVSGNLTWDGGTQLSGIPLAQRDMSMSLSGVKYDPPDGPLGFHWQIDGQCFIQDPVAIEETSWGGIKARFYEGSK
jgi:hypothetical protein